MAHSLAVFLVVVLQGATVEAYIGGRSWSLAYTSSPQARLAQQYGWFIGEPSRQIALHEHDPHGAHEGHDAHGEQEAVHPWRQPPAEHEEHDEHGHGAAHGEHGEHGGHHEEHEHVHSREAITLSFMLMGSVGFIMMFFYLVNGPLEVAKSTWRLINMVVSIFCAVLMYSSFRSCLVVLFGLEHSETGQVVLTLVLFFFFYAMVQVGLYFLKGKRHIMMLKAAGTIAAHITGFAAMYGFAGLQEIHGHEASKGWVCMVVVGATVVLLVLSSITSKVKEAVALYDGEQDIDEIRWVEAVEEVENDVISMSLGFLIMQVVRTFICGSLQSHEPAAPPSEAVDQRKTNLLLLCSLCFAMLTFMTTWMLHRHHSGASNLTDTQKRYVAIFQNVSSMSMAWCLLFWAEWQIYEFDPEGARISWIVLTALGLTVLGIVKIVALDMLISIMKTNRSAVRSIVLAIGLVVGFAWEKAFDVALEVLAVSAHKWHPHLTDTVTQLILAAIFLAVVLPAWALFILPNAIDDEDLVEPESGDGVFHSRTWHSAEKLLEAERKVLKSEGTGSLSEASLPAALEPSTSA